MDTFYVGNQLINNQAQAERKTWSLTTSQTVFPIRYDTGDVDVFKNGQKLRPGLDYSVDLVTRDKITLAIAGDNGDFIEIVGWNGYSVVEPSKFIRSRFNTTVSGTMTTYSCNYQAGNTDVFVNGLKKVLNVDYTGTDGVGVTFTTPLTNGTTVEVDVYESFSVIDINSRLTNNQSFARTDFVATAGQTSFNVAYSPGFIQVYANGVLLQPADYTATNSTTVVLSTPAVLNDEISVLTWSIFTVANTVQKTGDTMTGPLTLSGAPTNTLHAASKAYVDSNFPVTYAKLDQGVKYAIVSHKNKIINGKMDISQRGTSFPAIAASTYSLDRWLFGNITTGVLNATQQADFPSSSEFQNSLRLTVTTASTSDALCSIQQRIEGYNARDLIGRAFTLSFWVRSSKTGVHCVSFANSGNDRSYVVEYTVNAANTWEYKTATVSGGLITTGTWDWTTGIGLNVRFTLRAAAATQNTAGTWQTGSFQATSNQVNCLDTIGNIFAITGVQLEVGSAATPFEHRPYGTELSLCRRYYETGSFSGFNYAGGAGAGFRVLNYGFKVTKRATPTLSYTNMTYINASAITDNASNSDTVLATVTATAAGALAASGTFIASVEL